VTDPSELTVRINRDAAITALVYAGDAPAEAALILAHGAGAGQHSAFMTGFARALAARGVETITFNFPYTEQRRRIPDRRPVLEACYAAVIQAVHGERESARRGLFIGGKSMGGRIATHVAAAGLAESPRGIILLGYPLHPPGRTEDRRDSHLPAVGCPMLFVQGSRDTFGTPAELEPVLPSLAFPATLHVVAGGDHSFKVAQADRVRQAAALEEIQEAIVAWMRGLMGRGARETHSPRR
jgi:predicted alpha/beta-hydrolase family hydrolase